MSKESATPVVVFYKTVSTIVSWIFGTSVFWCLRIFYIFQCIKFSLVIRQESGADIIVDRMP